jgi:hypothetical protein
MTSARAIRIERDIHVEWRTSRVLSMAGCRMPSVDKTKHERLNASRLVSMCVRRHWHDQFLHIFQLSSFRLFRLVVVVVIDRTRKNVSCVRVCFVVFSKILSHMYRRTSNEKKRVQQFENERDYRKKKSLVALFVDRFPSLFLFFSSNRMLNMFLFYCVDGDAIALLVIDDVGVIAVAHESFLGMTVSGVGISWPVTVSGTIGGGGTDLLLFTLAVGSGLLAASLPCALATL